MNYLCIDYGDQYLGLAVAQGPLAEPLATIPMTHALEKITTLIDQYAIDAVILGLSEGKMAERTQAFADKLKSVTDLPIDFQDETLSSQETRERAAKMGMKKSRRESKIDHLVAAAILQDYLDSQPPDFI